MALQAMPQPQTVTTGRRPFSLTPYLFLAPALITIAVLTIFPFLYTVGISFTNYNLYHSSSLNPATFVGLKNFTDLLSPGGPFATLFLSVFTWTLIFALLTSALNYIVGMLLAVLLNNKIIPERAFYRTLLIVPWALPSTITVLVWRGLFNQTFGPIDTILTNIGLPAIPWLTDTTGTQAAILLVNLWLGFPFQMIVCLGGLQSIPSDVYEAASVDGASSLQRLLRITAPLVFRVTLPAALFTFSYNLTNFGAVYLLNKGGPPRTDGNPFAGTTDVLLSFIYNLTLNFYRYDKAAALGIIVFIITAAVSMIGFRFSGAFKEVS